MGKKMIVKNKKYVGKYVAMVSFNNKNVVASGKDPIRVKERADKKGFSSSVLIYVPDKNVYNVF